MLTFLSILASLLALAIIILTHEAGHFLVSRALKIPVKEFAIGFGPKLISWQRGMTTFSLRMIPMGGYVRYFGAEEDEDESLAFAKTNVFKRMLALSAGVAANILLAVVIITVSTMTYGVATGLSPVISAVTEGGPAQSAGIMAGDRIVAINNHPGETWDEIVALINAADGGIIDVSVERNGEKFTTALTPVFDEESQRTLIGINAGYLKTRLSLFEAVPTAFYNVWNMASNMLTGIKDMIFRSSEVQGDIIGIVGVVDIMSEGARQSFETFLLFAVMLSVNLALLNFLPFPALDGGKIIFLILEAIRGKPVDPNKEGVVHLAGMLLLMALAVVMTYKDIARLITGG